MLTNRTTVMCSNSSQSLTHARVYTLPCTLTHSHTHSVQIQEHKAELARRDTKLQEQDMALYRKASEMTVQEMTVQMQDHTTELASRDTKIQEQDMALQRRAAEIASLTQNHKAELASRDTKIQELDMQLQRRAAEITSLTLQLQKVDSCVRDRLPACRCPCLCSCECVEGLCPSLSTCAQPW